jgi:23S rRNA (adenine2503-C2)-methyltransferase
MKPLLRSMVPEQLAKIPVLSGEKSFRVRQLCEWIFDHHAFEWDEMSNLPANLRSTLAANFDLCALEVETRQVSADGTRKFLYRLRDGQTVESVIIPMADHATFCISSQVGCAMACSFCATARGGLVRHLEPGEIVDQVLMLVRDMEQDPFPAFGDRQFNVVFMGMGEPLDNWENVEQSLAIFMHQEGLNISRRRIQVSTSGPAEGLKALIRANPGIGLTLSLGGTTDASRKSVMPVPGRTGVDEAVTLAADYARISNRRATLAWVLIEDRTDSAEQAAQLAALAKKGLFKVNLIPMNRLDDGKLEPPDQSRILEFQKTLRDRGVPAFIRASGGQDIAAACGQLRRRRQDNTGK